MSGMNGLTIVHRFFVLCLAMLLSSLASADLQLPAKQWLEKMQTAAIHQNYRGVFVFSRDEATSSMRIVHRYDRGEEQERLIQLDGEKGEVFRRGAVVMCVFPDNRVVQVEPSQLTNKIVQAFAKFEPDHHYYRIEMAGQDRLIDRSSIKISVMAQDAHRYSYVLWLDQQTGLLLKSVLQNDQGVELERFQYTQIEFPLHIADDELQVTKTGTLVKHEVIPSAKKDRRWPSEMKWMVDWAPPGFKKVSGPLDPGDNVMVYSDGLASYSVFIEASENKMLPEGASLVGATVAYAQKFQFGEHRYNVTVVGEVPAMTAMMVAESVKPGQYELDDVLAE